MFALHTSTFDLKERNIPEKFMVFYRPIFLMKEIPEEDFVLHVQLTIDALSTGDLSIVKDFQKIFVDIMGAEYFLKIITEAMQQSKEVSPDVKIWIQKYVSDFSDNFKVY